MLFLHSKERGEVVGSKLNLIPLSHHRKYLGGLTQQSDPGSTLLNTWVMQQYERCRNPPSRASVALADDVISQCPAGKQSEPRSMCGLNGV